ncbi:MAG: PKD domain-containing protein [Euryarchaeota archaeon]|nr:PKD domain-containing protein [Euryarchaeota archaeon]
MWATDSASAIVGSNLVAITVSSRPSGPPLRAFGNGTISGYPGACGEGGIPGVLENVSFTGSARGGAPPYSFSWTFGDGSSPSSGRNVSHGYATLGDQNGTLTVTDAAGMQVSTVVPVIGPKNPGFSCPPQTRGPPAVFFGLTMLGFLFVVVVPLLAVVVAVPLVVLWRRRRRREPPPAPATPREERPQG